MLHRLLPTAAVAAIVAVPVFAADLAIEVRGVRLRDPHDFKRSEPLGR